MQRIKCDVNKKDIIEHIKEILGIPSKEIEKITDDVIEILNEELKKNHKINIKNFGKFSLKFKKARIGRNPRTKEKFTISERFSISFKASSFLKSKII